MKWKPPRNPIFDAAPGGPKQPLAKGSIATKEELKRVEELKRRLVTPFSPTHKPAPGQPPPPWSAQAIDAKLPAGRAQRFYPFLLVRTKPGDKGDRPLGASEPPSASPDIWVVPGRPETLPPLPSVSSKPFPDFHVPDSLQAGQPYTVYAHVWNLGLAPIVGATVEFFYRADWKYLDKAPTSGSVNRKLGMCAVDLAPRMSPECHQLVKCPAPLVCKPPKRVPKGETEVHLLYVRVSCIGDPASSNWHLLQERHLACHFLRLAPATR